MFVGTIFGRTSRRSVNERRLSRQIVGPTNMKYIQYNLKEKAHGANGKHKTGLHVKITYFF